MRRREFLAAGTAGAAVLAGCGGLVQTRPALAPPLVEDRPDAVYVPTHYEGMTVAGTATDGAYAFALTYTYPHRFWLVTGTHSRKVTIGGGDSLHLMPVVWHAETGIVPPDVVPSLTIRRDGEAVASPNPWPMLSQPMGFHFGDNVELPGEGTYAVEMRVGGGSARRTGSLSDAGAASVTVDLAYSEAALNDVAYTDVPPDREGTPGAIPLADMDALPRTQVPEPSALPGTVRGTGTSGDATFVVTTLADATPFGGDADEAYLAVSPRTPYNRLPLPRLSLSAALRRDGETVFEGPLTAAVDPDLGTHYGTAVPDAETGDRLALTVDAPPQVARHEGYETAFLDMPPVEVPLS